jgi:hypothetical protein
LEIPCAIFSIVIRIVAKGKQKITHISGDPANYWIPACAGMTRELVG